MSVRHLGGALRWVLMESLEERMEAMRVRIEQLGLTEDAQGGEGDVLMKKKEAEKGEILLRGIERLWQWVHAERVQCAQSGDGYRVRALDRELQEAAVLRTYAAQYLTTPVGDEGKANNEPNSQSSECTSEVSKSSSFSVCFSDSGKILHPKPLSSHLDAGIQGGTTDLKSNHMKAMYGSPNQYNEERIRPKSSKDVRVRSSQGGPGEWMEDRITTPSCTTDQIRCSSAVLRRTYPQSDPFRIYGVAVEFEQQRVIRRASSQGHQKNYRTSINTDYTTGGSNEKGTDVRAMESTDSVTDSIKVVDASGAGVSIVMRRMVRPTSELQKQRREVASAGAVNRAYLTRQPELTVRHSLKVKPMPQGATSGFREANEAAAVAVDAAMAAVAASSTSTPQSPLVPPTRCSSGLPNTLNKRGTKSRFSRQRSEERNSLGARRRGQSLRSYRALDTSATFVQLRREEGNRYVQNKQYEEAVQAYSEAIEHDPDSDILLCNRAVAYLFMNQHALALMDCETVLRRSPSNLKAHWRAARALLYGNKVQDAKRHYRIALQLCMDPVDERNITAEMRATRAFEMYYTHMKECRWAESVSCADQLLCVFGSTGPCSLPWHCRKLEAMLHIDSWRTLDYIKRCRVAHPTNSELTFLHAKCLFFCVHDPKSTKEVVELIHAARCQKEKEGGTEDSRYTHLERTVSSFERHRDRGNSAYENGDWSAAHMAYTRCLSLDPLNKSLIAVTYCNRAAACMQGGRWDEALSDVHLSIQVNDSNAKAYARRARIYLHFLHDRAKMDINYIQCAIGDLTRAVELAPTDENKRQLAEVINMWQNEDSHHKSGSDSNKNNYTEKSNNAKERFHAGSSNKSSGYFYSQRRSSNGQGSNNSGNNNNKNNKHKCNDNAQPHSRTHCARVLGLDNAARLDAKSLARAYHEAALRWHPDKWAGAGPQEHQVAEQRFKEVNMAYQSLKEMFVRC